MSTAPDRLDVLSEYVAISQAVQDGELPIAALGMNRDDWNAIVHHILSASGIDDLIAQRIDAEARADRAERASGYWERSTHTRASERDRLEEAICDALGQMGEWGRPRALDGVRRTLTVAMNEVAL